MFSKYAWSLYIWKHSTSKVSPKKCSFHSEMSCAQTLTRFVWGLYIWKYSRRKRNKALQTKTTGKEQMIKTYGERAACRSACMDFRVQACNSNYITWKQIQIIDTLVAKFRKAHDATPQHDTFKTPKTSFSKPQQLWRHLEVPLQFRCIVLKPRRQHVSTHGYTIMEQPVARDLFQSEAAGIMLVEPQQSSNNSLCSHPVASNTSQSGITCHKRQKR